MKALKILALNTLFSHWSVSFYDSERKWWTRIGFLDKKMEGGAVGEKGTLHAKSIERNYGLIFALSVSSERIWGRFSRDRWMLCKNYCPAEAADMIHSHRR